jgi:hypothetical protein
MEEVGAISENTQCARTRIIKINNKPAEKKVVQMNYLFFCSELRNVGQSLAK